ncbi:hypothetical protein C8J57DRAFT_1314111 [Mycena rebaudengoi]|nr:hypothetical protein C8J57DRAFT_1314111 [Mycena rebaudengoi]
MSFSMCNDAELVRLHRHLKDVPLQALCAVRAGTDVGAADDFNSSRSLVGDAFVFQKGPSFTDRFEAAVFGKVTETVQKGDYTLVTLVQPYEPGPVGSDVRELADLFNAQAVALDGLVDIDNSRGLGWYCRRGGYSHIFHWTGQSAYNGPRVTVLPPRLEIYVRLSAQFPVPHPANMFAYICDFSIIDANCREYAITALRAL